MEPRIENNINEGIPHIVNPVNGIIEVENYSENPIIYGKGTDTEMIQISAATQTPDICKSALPLKILQIHKEYEDVFDKNLIQGASQHLSSSIANWNLGI